MVLHLHFAVVSCCSLSRSACPQGQRCPEASWPPGSNRGRMHKGYVKSELLGPLNYCWCSLLGSKVERGVVNVYPNNLLAGAVVRMRADLDVHGTLYLFYAL